jgi:hypothetical protein
VHRHAYHLMRSLIRCSAALALVLGSMASFASRRADARPQSGLNTQQSVAWGLDPSFGDDGI